MNNEGYKLLNDTVRNDKTKTDDLVKFIPGPDFPTGAIVYDKKALQQAYATGKGGVVLRAKTEIIESKGGTFKIIVSEVPYQINKALILERIAELVKNKKIDFLKIIMF